MQKGQSGKPRLGPMTENETGTCNELHILQRVAQATLYFESRTAKLRDGTRLIGRCLEFLVSAVNPKSYDPKCPLPQLSRVYRHFGRPVVCRSVLGLRLEI
jgi:hypothetical protein